MIKKQKIITRNITNRVIFFYLINHKLVVVKTEERRDLEMFKYLSITKDTERAKKFFENFLAYTTTAYSLNELMKQDVDSFNLVDVRAY